MVDKSQSSLNIFVAPVSVNPLDGFALPHDVVMKAIISVYNDFPNGISDSFLRNTLFHRFNITLSVSVLSDYRDRINAYFADLLSDSGFGSSHVIVSDGFDVSGKRVWRVNNGFKK